MDSSYVLQDVIPHQCDQEVSENTIEAQINRQNRPQAADVASLTCCRATTVITVSCGECVAAFPVNLEIEDEERKMLCGFLKMVNFLENHPHEKLCRVSVAGEIENVTVLRDIWYANEVCGDFWAQDTPIGPILHFCHPLSTRQLAYGIRASNKMRAALS